jgi:Fur family ferric uptake transcriptional regulator
MTKKNRGESGRLAQIRHDLQKAHLRVTDSRVAVLEALLGQHGPFTVEEIHSRLVKKICDLATVYRSLGSLEKAGMIRRCEFGDGTARYELSESESHHHHHHVICRKCKKIVVLDGCELADIDRIAQNRGFQDITHSLEFFGICAQCVA